MNRKEMKELIERHIPRLAEDEKERWKNAEKLRKDFVRDFSPNKIAAMQLDEYVIGKGGNNPSFCYRLEQETRDLGLIFGATAFKFGIFCGKSDTNSSAQYRFANRWGKTPEQAFASVKNEILSLLQTAPKKDFQALDANHLYSIVKGKLLFLYHPNEYFPIYSRKHLRYFIAELNINTNSTSSVEMQHALMEYWKSFQFSKKYSSILFMHLLYQEFPEVKLSADLLKKEAALPALDIAIGGTRYIDQMPPISFKSERNPVNTESAPKIDYIEQQKQRKRIGNRGEAIVLSMEEKRLQDEGRPNLAENIQHVSDNSDREGYDILSFEIDGSPRYIEVKATSASNLERGFYISANEFEKAKTLGNYYIYFVFSAMSKNPKILPVKEPDLQGADYNMEPVSYHVTENFQEDQENLMKNKSKNSPNTEEVILKIGAEGGSLIIHRFLGADGNWKFVFTTDERTMADFLDEDDQNDLVTKHPQVDSFEEALQLMDKYPWHMLYLIKVHQDYADIVESEKQKRLAKEQKF